MAKFEVGNKFGSGRPLGAKNKLSRKIFDDFIYSIPSGETKTREQLIIEKAFTMSMDGNPYLLKLLFQYLYGVPPQSVDIDIKDHQEIQVKVIQNESKKK